MGNATRARYRVNPANGIYEASDAIRWKRARIVNRSGRQRALSPPALPRRAFENDTNASRYLPGH